MKYAKSLFISVYISLAALALLIGGYQTYSPSLSPNMALPLLAAGLPSALFFAWLFLFNPTKLSRNPWLLMIGGAIAYFLLNSHAPYFYPSLAAAIIVGIVCPWLYIVWYSHFADREKNDALATGTTMPVVDLKTTEGQSISSANFHTGKALWVFYRGNWCPICVAQIRELAAQYKELEKRGVHVLMISPQGEKESASLASRMDAPMKFLQDTDNQLARALKIVDETGLPLGLQVLGYDTAVPMPTVILTDNGKIIWRDVTDNYRVRPEPDVFLKILDGQKV